jgi:uncharacterized protein (DUF433 family)
MMGKGEIAMNLPLETDPLPIYVDHGSAGALRVGPTRVTLEVVLTAYLQGYTPEQIIRQYDVLNLADVYTVIGHYLRHKTVFDEHLAECDRRFQERRNHSMANGQAGLKERLLARLAARQADITPVSQ